MMTGLTQSTDVFVIGGGPAGLAAAIAARRRGFDVTVADRSEPPIDKACGEGIMPDGVAAAAALGISLEGAGARPFRGIRFCERDLAVEAPFPQGVGFGMRRTALHELMVERAAEAGVRLMWGASVTGIERDGVRVGGRAPARALDRRRRWRQFGGAALGRSGCLRARWPPLWLPPPLPVAPWSDFMEIHWGEGCQLYVTPVGGAEVCVVLISRDHRLRLDHVLPRFPLLARRLAAAGARSSERGGVSASRRLERVCRGNVALVGDASGSVDAITGEGLCLLFQQAVALADSLAAGDLHPTGCPPAAGPASRIDGRFDAAARPPWPACAAACCMLLPRVPVCFPACWPCTWVSFRFSIPPPTGSPLAGKC
jgi:menaquinone-9 beta-reductase